MCHNSSFFGYCYSCKAYGHRATKCRNKSRIGQVVASRNKNVVCQKCNAYGHNALNCKIIDRCTPNYVSKNPFATLGNMNVIFYSCNIVGHRNHECRRKSFQSYGNPFTSSFNENENMTRTITKMLLDYQETSFFHQLVTWVWFGEREQTSFVETPLLLSLIRT